MTTNVTNDIMMIVDESGSMELMGKEPVQAINNFIKEQQKLEIKDTKFSLWKFNSKISCVYNDENLNDIKEFDDFKPDGLTALFDCIGKSITEKLESKRNQNVICVILTDGDENASKNYELSKIKSLIKKAETFYGWSFLYLGANQDVFKASNSIGITSCAEFLPEKNGDLINITRSTSETVSFFRQQSQECNTNELKIETILKKNKKRKIYKEKLPSPLPPLSMLSRQSAVMLQEYRQC